MSYLVVKAFELASGPRSLVSLVIDAAGEYLDKPELFDRDPDDEAGSFSNFPSEPEGAPNDRFAVALVTGLVGFLAIFLVQHTLKVILTLAFVESPPAIYLPIESEDLDARNRKPAAMLGVSDTSETYITASIRGSIKHLRAQAGAFALWRGLSASMAYAIAYMIVRAIVASALGALLPVGIVRPVASFTSFVALTRFSMACTHIIISQPQPKTWISRLFSVPWSTARKSLPAMARFALVTSISAEIFVSGVKLNIHPAAKSIVFIIGLLMGAFITFPIKVALVRVQASLLPDNQEAIVSFDRNFGKLDGATVSFRDSLKSVGCAGWRRIYKVAVKTILITTAMTLVVVAIVGVEMVWVMAGAPKKELGDNLLYAAQRPYAFVDFFCRIMP